MFGSLGFFLAEKQTEESNFKRRPSRDKADFRGSASSPDSRKSGDPSPRSSRAHSPRQGRLDSLAQPVGQAPGGSGTEAALRAPTANSMSHKSRSSRRRHHDKHSGDSKSASMGTSFRSSRDEERRSKGDDTRFEHSDAASTVSSRSGYSTGSGYSSKSDGSSNSGARRRHRHRPKLPRDASAEERAASGQHRDSSERDRT